MRTAWLGVLLLSICLHANAEVWKRHIIDDSSQGADGVRLADFNGDGRLDIVTGWEQGGVTRICFQPEANGVRAKWPSVTVGPAKSVEDAVAVDLDSDGQLDVVSSTEGKTRSLFVHWAPANRKDQLNATAWKTEAIPGSVGAEQWMYCVPLQVDGKRGIDLVTGSKGSNASVGWWESPRDPRKLDDWKYHRLIDAGWIMSLIAHDFDLDGDLDILVTDRKGNARGAKWLEMPAGNFSAASSWKSHEIGATDKEVMFAQIIDLDRDAAKDVLTITRNGTLDLFRRTGAKSPSWDEHSVPFGFDHEHGKSLFAADFDGDQQLEIAITTRPVPISGPGVAMLRHDGKPFGGKWTATGIGGPDGSKFDLLEAIDLDGDGDLDLLTCEEVANLGVIWYENPLRPAR